MSAEQILRATLPTSRGVLSVTATWTGSGYADVALTCDGTGYAYTPTWTVLCTTCGRARADRSEPHGSVPLSSLTDDERARLDAVLAAAAQDRARAEVPPVESTAALRARVAWLHARVFALAREERQTRATVREGQRVLDELRAAQLELARRAEGER